MDFCLILRSSNTFLGVEKETVWSATSLRDVPQLDSFPAVRCRGLDQLKLSERPLLYACYRRRSVNRAQSLSLVRVPQAEPNESAEGLAGLDESVLYHVCNLQFVWVSLRAGGLTEQRTLG